MSEDENQVSPATGGEDQTAGDVAGEVAVDPSPAEAQTDVAAEAGTTADPQPEPAAPQSGAEASATDTASSEPVAESSVDKGDLYTSNDELLAAIDAKPGEKVTSDYIDSRIAKVAYAKIDETVTVCSVTLDNGFSVRGESACVDPANFDEKIGKTLAYKDAYGQLWKLFGFRLAEARFLRSKA